MWIDHSDDGGAYNPEAYRIKLLRLRRLCNLGSTYTIHRVWSRIFGSVRQTSVLSNKLQSLNLSVITFTARA